MIWPSVQLCSVCDLLRFLARSFFLFISNMFFCTEFHVDVSTVIKHFFPSSQLFSFHFCQFLCMFFSDLAHFAFFFHSIFDYAVLWDFCIHISAQRYEGVTRTIITAVWCTMRPTRELSTEDDILREWTSQDPIETKCHDKKPWQS